MEKGKKYLLLLVRNIKEGADTRSQIRKANRIFFFTYIIQVDNATYTKIKILSVNPAWDSSAGSCIIAQEPRWARSPLLLWGTLQCQQWPLSTPHYTGKHPHHMFWTFLMSRIPAPIIPKLPTTKNCLLHDHQPEGFEICPFKNIKLTEELAGLTVRPQAARISRRNSARQEHSKRQ